MNEEVLPEEEKSFFFYSLYFIGSIVINLACVSLHEGGHALIYLFQGYKVSFHFTKADPINGIETVLGAAGGLTINIVFALLFCLLFTKYKNIVFYMVIAGNTLFSRVIVGVPMISRGRAFEDESLIGNSVNINPLFIEVFIWVVLASIFIIATRTLIIQNSKRHSKYIILLTIIACVISLVVVAPLDAKGI